MTIRQAIVAFERMSVELPEIGRESAVSVAEYGLDRAKVRSSGPYSSGQLAAMDHPFARRHPSPTLDPTVINVQTGQFRAAWTVERSSRGAIIANRNAVADYLEHGTSKMVERGIGAAVGHDTAAMSDPIAEKSVWRNLALLFS